MFGERALDMSSVDETVRDALRDGCVMGLVLERKIVRGAVAVCV